MGYQLLKKDVVEAMGYASDKNSPEYFISNIIAAALSLLGVVFLVLMLYGGYLWMTDQGNEEQVSKAKKIIINGAIGLVIVMAAYAISIFIFNSFSGTALKP